MREYILIRKSPADLVLSEPRTLTAAGTWRVSVMGNRASGRWPSEWLLLLRCPIFTANTRDMTNLTRHLSAALRERAVDE